MIDTEIIRLFRAEPNRRSVGAPRDISDLSVGVTSGRALEEIETQRLSLMEQKLLSNAHFRVTVEKGILTLYPWPGSNARGPSSGLT